MCFGTVALAAFLVPSSYLRTKWRRPSLRTRRRESLRTRSWPRRQAAHEAAGADAFLPTIGVRNLWSCFQLSVTLYALRREYRMRE